MAEFEVVWANWASEHEALIRLRNEVFVEEQKVPLELELDGLDQDCQHVKAVAANSIIGCARLLPDFHVGRMCVLKDWRGRGVGSAILAYLIDFAREQKISLVQLNAQVSAAPFYRRFGFEAHGEIFLDAGIEHSKMTLIIDP